MPLFALDDRDLRAELAPRQSELAIAEAKLQKLLASPRKEEIPPAETRVHEAQEVLRDAQVQVQLIESVKDKRAVREEDVLRRSIAVDAGNARLEQATADLTLLEAELGSPMLKSPRRKLRKRSGKFSVSNRDRAHDRNRPHHRRDSSVQSSRRRIRASGASCPAINADGRYQPSERSRRYR
jgi:multidrug resistance efflux pump